MEHFSPNSSPTRRVSEIKDNFNFTELFSSDSLLELCNSFWMPSPDAKDVQPYLRGCKWSPDGTCCLSVVNRDGFHIMELPRDLYEGCPAPDRMITLLPAVIHVKECGLVYDFCWYPQMNSHIPETCSWISTKINSPIQMWDAYDGSLRCSYRGYNAVDEMEPAISVTFINNGERIVGGYKNCLRTFDVERPGRDFVTHKMKTPASCFATYGSLLAVGSWAANIKLFSIPDSGTYRSVANMHAHTGGITHLQFTPDGTKLVSGARKDHSLCVWDMRYHRRPLNILKRIVSTNQRIYFDISACGRYLVSGGTDGVIRVWDNEVTKWTEEFNVKQGDQENATFRFRLHGDCCNSISIHPSRPILATGSGQFHFLDPVKAIELDCGDNISSELQLVNETKELTDKIVDQDIAEVSLSKKDIQESKSEQTPAKKPKWSNDMQQNTVKESIDIGSCVTKLETSNTTLSNQENICEYTAQNQPTIGITNVVETPTEDEYLRSESKNNTFDKLHFEKTIDCPLPCEISEVANVIETNTFHNSSLQMKLVDTNSQVVKLNETDSGHNNCQLDKHYDNNCIRDSTSEFDDDYNNDIENKIKYSAYAENNLTFWWIGKIFEVDSRD